MTKEQLQKGKEIEKEIKDLEIIVYYSDVYKTQKKHFSYTYFDESSNEWSIKIDEKHTLFFLDSVKRKIASLKDELADL